MNKPLQGKNPLFCLTIIGITALSLQSCKKEQEIPNSYKFSEKSKLEIADFRGYPDIWGDYDAETHSGFWLDYEEKIENGKLVLVFTSYSFFSSNDSWFREDSKVESLLKHEQLHFDISEVCCRLMKQKLSTYHFTKKYLSEIEDIYLMGYSDLFGWQHDYDEESEHSINKKGQKHWEEYVAKTLLELSAFAPETLTVKTNVPMTQEELNLTKVVLKAPGE